MLKRNPSLTEQVKSHLKQRINNAEFVNGRIPSEPHLAKELNVSRNTVRDALSRLEMEGVIYRRQGAGTFINEANQLVKTRLEEILPYDTLIQEHGYAPDVQLLSVTEESASHETAQALKLASDETVLQIHKLFLADDKPVIFTCTWISKMLITRPYQNEDFKAATYQFLPDYCQQILAYFLSDIVPLIAPPWLVDHLDLPQQAPTALLSFIETGYNQENEPLVRSVSYFRDDLLRLRLIRRPGS